MFAVIFLFKELNVFSEAVVHMEHSQIIRLAQGKFVRRNKHRKNTGSLKINLSGGSVYSVLAS